MSDVHFGIITLHTFTKKYNVAFNLNHVYNLRKKMEVCPLKKKNKICTLGSRHTQ